MAEENEENGIIEEEKAEIEPPTREKIIEEEYDSGSRSNDSKRNSTDEDQGSPRQAPCSFFISTSPPLPALGKSASIPSEISTSR